MAKQKTTRLDGFASNTVLCSTIEDLCKEFDEGEADDINRMDQLKGFLKEVYLYSVDALLHGDRAAITIPKPPYSLLVKGFDAEQIWAQLECIDSVASQRHKRRIPCFDQDLLLVPDHINAELDLLLNQQEDMNLQDIREEDTAEKDSENILDQSLQLQIKDTSTTHPIEDTFFTLKEMSSFLDDAENEEMDIESDGKDLLGEEEESETDEEGIDIFQDQAEAGDTPNADNAFLNKPGNAITYRDMYGPERHPSHLSHERGDRPHWERAARIEYKERHNWQTAPSRTALERETIQKRIHQLEDEAMEEKEWPFRGEISATNRPLNSALEVDLDHDTTVKPPPEPTQEHMDAIEDLIKRRIAERKFDDVQRLVPPPIEETRRVAELDDSKAKKGLGELYADAYVKNAHGHGTLEEKEERLQMKARILFKDACSSLDALTHFHFAPQPIVEDFSIKSTMPSVRMEEAVPMGMTDSSSKPPQEFYHPTSKTGETINTTELTKEERKQLRAKRKRIFKASKTEDPSKNRTAIIGRKSLSKKTQALTSNTSSGQKQRRSFFEQIQSHQQNKKNKQKTSIHQNSIQMKL